jgi:hypothetical protein
MDNANAPTRPQPGPHHTVAGIVTLTNGQTYTRLSSAFNLHLGLPVTPVRQFPCYGFRRGFLKKIAGHISWSTAVDGFWRHLTPKTSPILMNFGVEMLPLLLENIGIGWQVSALLRTPSEESLTILGTLQHRTFKFGHLGQSFAPAQCVHADVRAWLGLQTLAWAWLGWALASHFSCQSPSRRGGGLGLAWLGPKPWLATKVLVLY